MDFLHFSSFSRWCFSINTFPPLLKIYIGAELGRIDMFLVFWMCNLSCTKNLPKSNICPRFFSIAYQISVPSLAWTVLLLTRHVHFVQSPVLMKPCWKMHRPLLAVLGSRNLWKMMYTCFCGDKPWDAWLWMAHAVLQLEKGGCLDCSCTVQGSQTRSAIDGSDLAVKLGCVWPKLE